MTNREIYLSILFSTAEMYCREIGKLEAEMEADRAYPLCCMAVGPKLESIVIAARLLLCGKRLFAIGVDGLVTDKCSRVADLLEDSAIPLLRKMRDVAAPYEDMGDMVYSEVLRNAEDSRPFRVAMRDKYLPFLRSLAEIKTLMEELKAIDDSLSSHDPNYEWEPGSMLV